MLYGVLKVIKAKIYPNSVQRRRLEVFIGQACYTYNLSLSNRRCAWEDNKQSLTRFDQTRHLTLLRRSDDRLSAVPVEIERDAIRRVDLAFSAFFRRHKAGIAAAGFPRFKTVKRYNSFTVPAEKRTFSGNRVGITGIKQMIACRGTDMVYGRVVRLTVVHRPDGWFVRLLVDDGLTPPSKNPITISTGIDMGLNSFVTTSDGEQIQCPKFYRKMASRLRRAQKRVSRRKKGSHRRRKAVLRLQLIHQKIADCRMDFAHKLSKQLVAKNDLIVAEKLNIKGMVRSKLAKSILDAGWSKFPNYISYKAENAGKTFIQVNPAYTSQKCSGCGLIVPKTLSERVHNCPCGLVLDRDQNAARNILALGINTPTPVGSGNARGGALRRKEVIPNAAPMKREASPKRRTTSSHDG